mgnify:CR=1 FL=1
MNQELTLAVSSSFEAAHHLVNPTAFNEKCLKLHGHSYRYTIFLKGEVQDGGMVEDFGAIKRYIINEITELYDHSDLNRFFYNPTAEMLVLDMAWRVEALIEDNSLKVKLTKIELAETDNNRVIWESQ